MPLDFDDAEEISVGQWMFIRFIICIPIVGLVYLIIMACGDNVDKRTYARAALVCMLFKVVIVILFLMLFGAIFMAECASMMG